MKHILNLSLIHIWETCKNKFTLQVRDFKVHIVGIDSVYLPGIEPIVKTLFPKGVSLRVDPVIIYGVRIGVVDALHLKRQPATITGGI